MNFKPALLCLPFLYLAACAHTPTVGEKMMAHSQEAKQIAKQWNNNEKIIAKANNMDKKGNKLIAQGNKDLAKGNNLVAKGNAEIKLGNKLVSQSTDQLKAARDFQKESEEKFVEKYSAKLD